MKETEQEELPWWTEEELQQEVAYDQMHYINHPPLLLTGKQATVL